MLSIIAWSALLVGAPLDRTPARVPYILSAEIASAFADWSSETPSQPIHVVNAELAASIERLEGRSASFKAGWERLKQTGVPLIVTAYGEIPGLSQLTDRLEQPKWMGAAVVWPEVRTAPVTRAAIVVRLDRLRWYSFGSADYERKLDAILVHEVYGHLLSAIEGGSVAAMCHDADDFHASKASRECLVRRVATVLGEISETAAVANMVGADLAI